MNYQEFIDNAGISTERLCREIYRANRGTIQIKKEATVVRNLNRIFDATLKLSNEKGFQAMTMRDFSRETGLSLGALYAYFASKDELLEMILRQGRRMVGRVLGEHLQTARGPVDQLETAIRLHLYLTEALQPWFYFSFMEAKNMNPREREKAIDSEMATDRLFAAILQEGQACGLFRTHDVALAAGAIKALLQDWYVKRWKFSRRGISVDRYAEFILDYVMSYHLKGGKEAPAACQ
ncbi:MAG: TetR/AcrR family transcriptional regulator [Desulfobacterales bacterium]|nr:TetR/AcrR family transcriptional regulator [Desulfobacterales bacterium]